jgi:carbon monoxide dehydrogenase subunit G
MRFEHEIIIPASREKARDFLDDFAQAASCLPGVEGVHVTAPGHYEGRVRIKVGPLGFNIAGQAEVEAEDGLDGWIARGEGKDAKLGAGVKASLEARLYELAADSTRLHIGADVQFSGPLAGLGQPLIKRKADALVAEFAQNLAQAIQSLG